MYMWISFVTITALATALLPLAGRDGGVDVLNRKGQTMSGVNESEKTELAGRVSPVSAEAADFIRRPSTTVERLPTTFFAKGAIYRVTFLTPSGPRAFTVGYANGEPPVFLQMNPAAFFSLAEKARPSLGSPDAKIAYATTFLEATRDFRHRFQILQNAADIELIQHPTPEEQERYRELQNKYKLIIHPPHVSETSSSDVVIFALVGQNLLQIKLTLAADGQWKRADQILEENLPIGYAK